MAKAITKDQLSYVVQKFLLSYNKSENIIAATKRFHKMFEEYHDWDKT